MGHTQSPRMPALTDTSDKRLCMDGGAPLFCCRSDDVPAPRKRATQGFRFDVSVDGMEREGRVGFPPDNPLQSVRDFG